MSNDQLNLPDYAWNWFALHSGQRLQLVNFWLVAVAFLATSYVQAQASHLVPVAVGVSLAGAISSVAFMRLDVRTQQLVQVAEDALQVFEEEATTRGHDDSIKLVHAAGAKRKSRLDSYRVIIRSLQLSVAGLFILAFIYTLAVVA